VRKDVAGRAAGNYRLAACAPQKQTPALALTANFRDGDYRDD